MLRLVHSKPHYRVSYVFNILLLWFKLVKVFSGHWILNLKYHIDKIIITTVGDKCYWFYFHTKQAKKKEERYDSGWFDAIQPNLNCIFRIANDNQLILTKLNDSKHLVDCQYWNNKLIHIN